MKVLYEVTVTGADDSTDIYEMFEIQEKYPFVEFGILLSEKYSLVNGVTGRFPSRAWIAKLIELNDASEKKLNLSGHICGRWVQKTLLGEFPNLEQIAPTFHKSFSRFQLNTRAEWHKLDLDKLCNVITERCDNNQGVIFQLDGVNDILKPVFEKGHANVAGLFDLSHGAGILPSSWPKPLEDIYCGYAGGLSPENVENQMEKILVANGNNETWIDAETLLRSPDNRIFDLEKVVQFLENSKPYVI